MRPPAHPTGCPAARCQLHCTSGALLGCLELALADGSLCVCRRFEAYEKSLPEIFPDDTKKEIATAAVAATKKKIFPPDTKREVRRVILKNFKLNKKEEQLCEVPAKKLIGLCSYAGLNRRR